MTREKKEFYLVDFQVLPEALKRTIRAKELLRSGEVDTIYAAVMRMGISRSAYYKYKDHVAAAPEETEVDALTIFLVMQNDPAVQNKLFRKLAKDEAEILTLTRGVPTNKLTTMTLTLRLTGLKISIDSLLSDIRSVKGIKTVVAAGED